MEPDHRTVQETGSRFGKNRKLACEGEGGVEIKLSVPKHRAAEGVAKSAHARYTLRKIADI